MTRAIHIKWSQISRFNRRCHVQKGRDRRCHVQKGWDGTFQSKFGRGYCTSPADNSKMIYIFTEIK